MFPKVGLSETSYHWETEFDHFLIFLEMSFIIAAVRELEVHK